MRHRYSWEPVRLVGAGVLAASLAGLAAPAVADHDVPFLPSAADTREGYVRIINHAPRSGTVRIRAVDDGGNRFGPLDLAIEADSGLQVSTADLENGNVDLGLAAGIGPGDGDWRLELTSDLDIEVLAYVVSEGGFVTSMHEVVDAGQDGHHDVPFFATGDEDDPASSLRLTNPGDAAAEVTIRGVDDQGETSAGDVTLSLSPGQSRTLSAAELQSGASVFQGSLGDGSGNWRLRVTADKPVVVQNLLASSTGDLTNLSASAGVVKNGVFHVPLFPAAADADRDGFVRVINLSSEAASVTIDVADAVGGSHDSLVLTIGAEQTVHFDSDDLEVGNADLGLVEGTGTGDGHWRLALSSDVDIEVLAFVRSEPDGFLTAMGDAVPAEGSVHRVPTFHPGNDTQASWLRVENPSAEAANVSFLGIDDDGGSPGGVVRFAVAAGHATTLTAAALEAGGDGFEGALGDGSGKWRLVVDADAPVRVMSLLAGTCGRLANLSSVPRAFAPQSETAFNDRAVGLRLVEDDPAKYIDFAADGRFSRFEDGQAQAGGYTFSTTGVATGDLVLAYDDGDACTLTVTFRSRFTGEAVYGCDTEDTTKSDWQLLKPTTSDGERTTYRISVLIPTLPTEAWSPDAVRAATVSASDGVATVSLVNGGYVEIGDYRYTCRNTGGCIIEDRVVKSGRIVRSPAMPLRDFDLADENRSSGGIAYANDTFYVADAADRKVYVYDTSGNHQADRDFDLAAGTWTAGGITLDDSRFYVADEILDDYWGLLRRKVWVYDADGQHLEDADFELDAGAREPLGIVHVNGRLYVTDAWTHKTLVHLTSGERDADADFDLDADNLSPRGVTHGDDRFFVVDIYDDKVYAYRTDGERDEDSDFVLAGGNSFSRGIAYVDGRFYVADARRVFAYPADRPDLVVAAFSADDPTPDAGESFALDVAVRNVGHRRSAATTLHFYRSRDTWISTRDTEIGDSLIEGLAVTAQVDRALELTAPTNAGFYYYGACIQALPEESRRQNCSDAVVVTVPVDIDGPGVGFALDADNGNPSGIAFAEGRFHVIDDGDERIYAYRTSAEHDPDSGFDLDAENGHAEAIAYARDRFYVVDRADDKVYAYRFSGERDSDADFDLDAGNQSPWAIAFGDDKFYVADATDGRLYAYDTSGQREANADIALSAQNNRPWGLEILEGRFYVVDAVDRHVYVYSPTGERVPAFEFSLDVDNSGPEGIAYVDERFYVVDAFDRTIYGYAIPASPDLVVGSPTASTGSPGAGGEFAFRATLQNVGNAASGRATVTYYLAPQAEYSTAGSAAGRTVLGRLAANAETEVSTQMTAPEEDGCYFCGACVTDVAGERMTSNNCSGPAYVVVGDTPELYMSRLAFYAPPAGVTGDPIEVSIGVTNRGPADSLPASLRITGGEEVVLEVPALVATEEIIFERIRIGSVQSGTTTFEMCLVDVPCERNLADNCRTRTVTYP